MRDTEELFDREDEYDAMLHRGLRLTGEDRTYFLRGRLGRLRASLSGAEAPRRIMDFGCGTGDTCHELAELYPDAEVVGVDTAERAVDHARRTFGSERISFRTVRAGLPEGRFDLCYVNGVFHHIAPEARPEALAFIRTVLEPTGTLALFENNPWNPGTRLVMSRIPFDRDAQPISPTRALRMLRSNGFVVRRSAEYLFFFPAFLRVLRGFEPGLRRVPLGGQYLVLAEPDAR